MHWITIIGGASRGKKFPLRSGVYSLGREGSCQIQLDSPMVSRLHSTIEVKDDGAVIIDHGSANGTIVNGARTERSALNNGDKIYIGDFVLEYAFAETKPQIIEKDTSAKRKKKLENALNSSLSLKTLLVLLTLILLGGWFIIFLVNSKVGGDLDSIAVSKGKELARYLAEKNKTDLANGNEMLMDVEIAETERGVKEASVIDTKGLILAPFQKQNKPEKDPCVLEALSFETNKTNICKTAQTGLYIMAHPIRSYNSAKGKYDTIGAAKIVYSTSEIIDLLPSHGKVSYIFLLPFIAIALIAYLLIKNFTLSPIKLLADNTEQARIAGNFETEGYPKEFLELAQSIKRLSANLQTIKSDEAQYGQNLTPQPKVSTFITNEKIDAILAVIPEPAVVFDNEKIILSINEQAVSLFNAFNSSPIGKKIGEIILEKKLLDGIEDLIEEALKSSEKSLSRTLEIGLKTFELSLSLIKDHSQNIEFGTLIIEKI